MNDASNPLELVLGVVSLLFIGGMAAVCILLVAANVYILMTSEIDRWRPIVSIIAGTAVTLMMAYVIYVALP